MKVLDTIRENYGFDSSIVGLKKTLQALAMQLISQKPAMLAKEKSHGSC